MDDIDYVNDKPTFLITYQEKTNDKVEIPILKPTMEIINKYNEDPDRIKSGRIIPFFSNPKINAYLKVIGELAKIKLKLTHHVARHTCATTVLLENDVPLDEVSKWLGHADIRSTRIYAQITKKKLSDTADRLNDIL
jgi:integrase